MTTIRTEGHDAFLREATEIGNDLARDAITWRSHATWVGRQVPEKIQQSRPQEVYPRAKTLPLNMYNGTAGIALFLGHLWRYTRQPEHWDVARGAILQALSLSEQVAHAKPSRKPNILGFYSGTMGVAWAAYELADILREPYLAEQARLVLDSTLADRNLKLNVDLMSGHAGAITALLSLHRHHQVRDAKDMAIELGETLLEKGERTETGAIAWNAGIDKSPFPLTGFSHGAAGFAYAYADLFRATGDSRWRDVCRDAVRYERDNLRPQERNWPDFRGDPLPKDDYKCNRVWCHGSAGIGLSRALMQDVLDDDETREEIEMARVTTGRFTRQYLIEIPSMNYMLCHGVAGNVECLWAMEAALDVPRALERARETGLLGIERFGHVAREKWGSRFVDWPTGHPGHRELGLFMGIAGVGFHMLRLHKPDEVPSILVPGVSWREPARVPYQGSGRGVLATA